MKTNDLFDTDDILADGDFRALFNTRTVQKSEVELNRVTPVQTCS